ncbi:acyl-protein thioesterase [Thelonectria olida]|uniref:Acyl-protein thioesterase n=1 Tax=Thelonectria olida TaxID=1576542 RepID=A0A9P9ARI8_9HYPO|nr:acyl-protein thioesterase [Thelonectria olida]
MSLLSINPQPSHPHSHTIIFLHGRGSTPRRLADSLTHLAPSSSGRSLPSSLPSVRWVFPAPPGAGPDTALFQWFAPYHERIQAQGLRDSVHLLRRILDEEAALLDGRYHRVVLVGFSQGAATAAHVLLHLATSLGGLVGFSGRMVFPGRGLADTRRVLREATDDAEEDNGDDEDDEAVRQTPVLLEHCADDHLVPVESGRVLRDTLRGFGAQVTWCEYPDGGHWLNAPDGVDDAIRFLVDVVGIQQAVE